MGNLAQLAMPLETERPTVFKLQLDYLVEELARMPEHERIEALNEIKRAIHTVSPLRNEPVDCIQWVRAETVQANDYNPNAVAPPEMAL